MSLLDESLTCLKHSRLIGSKDKIPQLKGAKKLDGQFVGMRMLKIPLTQL